MLSQGANPEVEGSEWKEPAADPILQEGRLI